MQSLLGHEAGVQKTGTVNRKMWLEKTAHDVSEGNRDSTGTGLNSWFSADGIILGGGRSFGIVIYLAKVCLWGLALTVILALGSAEA